MYHSCWLKLRLYISSIYYFKNNILFSIVSTFLGTQVLEISKTRIRREPIFEKIETSRIVSVLSVTTWFQKYKILKVCRENLNFHSSLLLNSLKTEVLGLITNGKLEVL